MAAYNVKYAEVISLENDCTLFCEQLAEAVDRLDSKMNKLVGLESFQGATAASIKSYFDAHRKLLSYLQLAADQLRAEYATQYYSKFSQAPIAEHHDNAQWPSNVLKNTNTKLKTVKDQNLSDAQRELTKAQNLLPAGITFSFPSAAAIQDEIATQVEKTKRVREGIADIEAGAARAFASESSGFNEMESALSSLLASFSEISPSMASFNSATFSSLVDSVGVEGIAEKCRGYQDDAAAIVVASQLDALEKEQERLQRSWIKQSERKAGYGVAGLVVSMGLFALSVYGLIQTAGASAPVSVKLLGLTAGTIGTGTSMVDAKRRVDQLNKMVSSDMGADRKEGSEVFKDAKGYFESAENRAKIDTSSKKKFNDTYRDAFLDDFKSVQDQKMDLFFDAVDDETAMKGKVAYKGGSAIYELITGNPRGAFSKAGKAVNVKVDYEMDEADKELARIVKRMRKLNELDEYIGKDASLAADESW